MTHHKPDHVDRSVLVSFNGEPGYTVDLRYDRSMPLDVQLWFGHGNVWTAARATFYAGLEFLAGGHGSDVLIQPFGDEVLVDLLGEVGSSRIGFARADIVMFLDDTAALVPAGEEPVEFDLDRELAHLLDGAL